MIWTDEHDECLVREILVVEPYQYKQGTIRRGEAWSQIAEIVNSIDEPKFRVNQRAVRDRYTLLEKTFKRKMREEEKASGVDPPELTDTELAIQELIDKFSDATLHVADCDKENADKTAAVEMRRKSLETFSESKKRNSVDSDDESPKCPKKTKGSGTETLNFLTM